MLFEYVLLKFDQGCLQCVTMKRYYSILLQMRATCFIIFTQRIILMFPDVLFRSTTAWWTEWNILFVILSAMRKLLQPKQGSLFLWICEKTELDSWQVCSNSSIFLVGWNLVRIWIVYKQANLVYQNVGNHITAPVCYSPNWVRCSEIMCNCN